MYVYLSLTHHVRWLNGNGSVAIPSGFYSIVTRCVEVRNYGASCPVSSVDVLGVLLPHQPPSSHVSVSHYTCTLKYRFTDAACF